MIFLRKNIFSLLVILLPVALYSSGLGGGFVWDDRTYFIENDILPHLKPWQLKEIFLHPSNFWGEHLPVRDLLYVIEYNMFGLSAFGYHAVSLGLYVLTCVMVFVFMKNFYSGMDGGFLPGIGGGEQSAFAVALIFAVHPVHVEGVSYISAQKDILCALFSIISAYFFYLYFNCSKKSGVLICGIFSYYLAVLSKLAAVGMFLFIPLLFMSSNRTGRPALSKASAMWGVVNLPVLLWLWKSFSVSKSYFGSTFEILAIPFPDRLVRAVKILGAHAAIVIKPYPLSAGYPFDPSANPDTNLIAGIAALALIIFFVLYFKKNSTIILGIGFFLFFMLPVLQLHGSIAGVFVYDRYLFVPVLGAAIVFERLLRFFPLAIIRWRALYLVVISVIVLFFGLIAFSYMPSFRNDVALNKNTYEKFPGWSPAAFNYVYSLIEAGQHEMAWDITAREDTFSSPAWVRSYFKGWIYLEQGKIEQAVSVLSYSSMLASGEGYFPFPSIPLGRALMELGRYRDAELEFGKVLSSEIYQPLEMYHARKELEKIRRMKN